LTLVTLHNLARMESEGRDVAADVARLLSEGADPHAPDDKGETAFNIAASNAPVTGRVMTLYWFYAAMAQLGGKGLNDPSGNHGSTLAQYMAKWLHDDEIDDILDQAVAAGMKVDQPNRSGWTPLTAAAAMGRAKAVAAFLKHYNRDAILQRTTEEYRTSYNGVPVVYQSGWTASEVAMARLKQDSGVAADLKSDLSKCCALILKALAAASSK
jgi:ankyrin repeat protein